jgi:hypothetical protein
MAMSDSYQYTRCGYITVDPDDAPTADESFADCLREIWENATPAARIAISHERYALGIRDKSAREYTATEQAVQDAIYAEIMTEAEQERAWEAQRDAEDAARQAHEEANWANERSAWAADWKADRPHREAELARQDADDGESDDDLPY